MEAREYDPSPPNVIEQDVKDVVQIPVDLHRRLPTHVLDSYPDWVLDLNVQPETKRQLSQQLLQGRDVHDVALEALLLLQLFEVLEARLSEASRA